LPSARSRPAGGSLRSGQESRTHVGSPPREDQPRGAGADRRERDQRAADGARLAAEAITAVGRQDRKNWRPVPTTCNCPAHKTAAVIGRINDLRGRRNIPDDGKKLFRARTLCSVDAPLPNMKPRRQERDAGLTVPCHVHAPWLIRFGRPVDKLCKSAA
jgi:hypothetical protein